MNITDDELGSLTEGSNLLVKLLAIEQNEDAQRWLATLSDEQLRNMEIDARWASAAVTAEIAQRQPTSVQEVKES